MKIKPLLLTFIFAFWLASCIPRNSPPTQSQLVTEASFKVALLLPRARDADGWNQSGYQGLLLIESELGAAIDFTEAVPEDEFETVFRRYAESGYDFVIGHGAQFVSAAETVAAEYPRVRFAVAGIYEGNNQNLGALALRVGEMGYLAGVVAALKTETNHVAYLSGLSNPVNQEIAVLYERGAKAMKPDIEVTSVWTGSWTDEEIAREKTLELIDAGADVIGVIAGQAAPVVHTTAAEAGIYTIGWSIDQYDLAPGSVITSVIENPLMMYVEAATLARRGQWEGKQYLFGMFENAHHLAPFRDTLSEEDVALIEEIKIQILAGEIDITP